MTSANAIASLCDLPIDARAAKAQKHVFVFRLLSARVLPNDYRSVGEIELVDPIRGSSQSFRSVRYSNNVQCGLKLVPGNYYVAFTSQAGPGLFLHSGNLFAAPPRSYDNFGGDVFSRQIRLMLDGRANKIDWDRSWEELSFIPSPPDPCPPPGAH